MSHHDSIQRDLPDSVVLKQSVRPDQDLPQGNMEVSLKNDLLIAGQGCVVFGIPFQEEAPEKAHIHFSTKNGIEVTLELTSDQASFYYKKGNQKECFTLKNEGEAIIAAPDDYTHGIDSNPKCLYWVSIDGVNKRLRYGKGEMRYSTRLIDYQYDYPKNLFTKEEEALYPFVDDLHSFHASDEIELLSLWKDPLVTEPPTHVVPSEKYRMDDAAEANQYVTAPSLSEECQILYGNVKDFQLNTEDFPDFGQAIEYSIRTKGCLGYKIIQHKLKNDPFKGEKKADADFVSEKEEYEYKEVYLRITLGQSQGESPGIPYVMEIWPSGCASPVHHHGYTHAIIKVLRGEIDVDVFRMLPGKHNSKKGLTTVKFGEEEVTYLMPQANQYHLLKNNSKNADTCITIQCYAYGKKDDVHYATFDYIENNELGHFDPISDCDFLEFKETIRKEWDAYLRGRPWEGTEILE